LVASVSAIIGFIAVPAIGNIIGVDSPYYWIIAITWLLSGITHLVLIPVVAFKQPKVKAKEKSAPKESRKAKPAKSKSDA
jgi:hypothetical protein